MIDFPTSPDSATLKTCPVCHSDQVHLFELQDGLYQVSCENDDDHFCVQVLGGSPKEATERWNDRSGHAPTPSEPHEATYLRGWNEAIEHCASLCDGLRRKDYSMENADWVAGTSDCADAIRALSDTSTGGNSK